MKAIVYRSYGPPDVLRLEEIPVPTPAETEVLIRVRAASLNPLDKHLMTGSLGFIRLMDALSGPRTMRPGVDVAGVVEAIGSGVTRFKPGDAVFGTCGGALAEYGCTPESKLALKPANVTFEQAAATPVAGFTALTGLRDRGHVERGQRVLINGAAGGVGTFAVQIAKWLGAEVTGVCSTRNLDLVRAIGADHVVDYTCEDFTANGQRYDVILDCAGSRSVSACRRALEPRGTYLLVGMVQGTLTARRLVGRLATVFVPSLFTRQTLTFLVARPSTEALATLQTLLREGTVTPVIDTYYPLHDAASAFRHLATGHARGKVIVTVQTA